MCILPYNYWRYSFRRRKRRSERRRFCITRCGRCASVGDAYDNAMAESFFASLERELLSVVDSKVRRRRRWLFLNGSKVGTTRIVGIPPWDIVRRSNYDGASAVDRAAGTRGAD